MQTEGKKAKIISDILQEILTMDIQNNANYSIHYWKDIERYYVQTKYRPSKKEPYMISEFFHSIHVTKFIQPFEHFGVSHYFTSIEGIITLVIF